ncbi:MAG TPA: relaxase/mobilization nuclease domain-containing protein [Bryobacteraceae bacterium]|nr:relaxase/mobilization nuclease domain-containing protein [Bryobacteraceae bacterium]
MIVKGKARSGPAQLAAYLLRVDDGERPSLIELFDGGEDLQKAFIQWHAIGQATRGEKTLYHAQIAPADGYAMTPQQYRRAAEILAEDLGMKDHPRAIVVHEGGEHPHAHVVFQRTDADTMTMWDTSDNYRKHEMASLRMELEFGHAHVPGKHAKRDRGKQPEFPRAEATQADHQQAARTELTVDERKEQVTALRAASDNAPSFKSALEDAGYILARGDRRGFVIVDGAGEVYSLSKQVTDLKGKEFKAFMDGIDPKTLPSVEEAKALQKAASEQKSAGVPAPAVPAPTAETPKQGVEASKFVPAQAPPEAKPAAPQDPKLVALEKAIAERQAEEARKYRDLHAHELRQKEFDLDRELKDKLTRFEAIQTEQRQALKERHAEQRTGIQGFIDAVKLRLNPTLAAEQAQARRKETLQLVRRHEQEKKDYLALLQQTKQLELDNTKERQGQQLRDVGTKNAEEKERYIREYRDSQRILEDLKLQQERQQRRDGPEPPGRVR